MTQKIPTFQALLDALRQIVPINAATALRYRESSAERIFSTHPERFADVGCKDFQDTPTMRKVRLADAPILTAGVAALRDGFGDWQSILATDSDAILNVPVRAASGEALGQLNLMGRSGDFTSDTCIRIQEIVNRAADCFLDPADQEALP